MPLFLDSQSQAQMAGVFAIEIAPPRVIEGVSNGFVGLVGQFAWGPKQTIVTPANASEFYDTFEPAGSPRSSLGYYAVMRRRRLPLKVVRVLGSGSAAATATMTGTGGNTVATAKYHGVLGNSITLTQAAAASGDTSKRDYTVTLTDSVTGTTQEVYADVPLPTGTAVTVDVSKSKLLASLTLGAAMSAFPSNATTSLSSGSNGSAAGSSDYIGTAGTANQGLALFENEGEVRVVVVDDCGNSLRAAVNSGLAAHATTLRDRIAVLQGNADAADWSTVKGYVTGGLVTDYVVFVGAWAKVFDDAGVVQTSPISTMIASAMVNLEPHQSHAWWDDVATQYYSMVESIVANFAYSSDTVRAEALSRGIALPCQLASGQWAQQHDRNTNTAPSKRFTVRRRTLNYLALSLQRGLTSYVNGPNFEESNVDLKTVVDNFLDSERSKKRIIGFSTSIAANTPTSLGLGEFLLDIDAPTPAPREKIFLRMNVGPTVTLREEG